MIKIDNLHVVLAGKKILDDVSITIPKSEITVILGKSGSGKSVLIKTINGLIKSNSGTIQIDDFDVNNLNREDLRELRKNIGFLFQGGALFDSLNVYQNVALPLFEHTRFNEKEIKTKVIDKLQLVGLEGILDKFPSELSGGMQKRVALARSIILEPDYIFYDEPTTGLDPFTSTEIIKLMLKLKEKLGITTVVITHDKECIHSMGDNIVLINDKKVHFKGTRSEFMSSNDKIVRYFID